MRFGRDYYNIKVKDAFYTSYANANPVNACWNESGNQNTNVNNPTSAVHIRPLRPGKPILQEHHVRRTAGCPGKCDSGNAVISSDIVWYNLAQPLNGLAVPAAGRGPLTELSVPAQPGNRESCREVFR